MLVFRIIDNKIWTFTDPKSGEYRQVKKLGFGAGVEPEFRIPDEYLKKQEFVVMRTCFGLGDWGILTSMPRLLKQKYPSCKVYLPSEKLLNKLFPEDYITNWINTWPDPYKSCELVFKNNPYIDGIKDSVDGEIYHDHFRVYKSYAPEFPLVEQMLKFWQFEEDECKDSAPDLFWSDEEIQLGDSIIKEYFGDEDFAGFIATTSELKDGEFYKKNINERIIKVIKEFDKQYKYVYYSGVDIKETPFKDNVNVKLDFKNTDISIRVQLYIRSRAKFNIGYQSSMYDMLPRYTKIICVPNYCSDYDTDDNLGDNYSRVIEYLR